MCEIKTTWIETSGDVYFEIYRKHELSLVVFSSFTSKGDDEYASHPVFMTEWGFKNSDVPLIKCEGVKENKEQKYYDWQYFIAAHTIVEDD